MGRPCEEVIVISDHEEGEITDSDFCPRSPSPARFVRRCDRKRARPKRSRVVDDDDDDDESCSSSCSCSRVRRPTGSTAPKRPNRTSLRSRLTNMIDFSNRRNRIDATANIDGLENLSSADEDFSDDAELLRELALKSKRNETKSEAPQNETKRQDENVDDEIRELRLAALKSAVLKKASKRKRRERISSSFASDYDSYMFNVANPLYPNENDDDSYEIKPKSEVANENDREDESEEILRLNLLASLKNGQRASPRPNLIASCENVNDKSVDSNLIVRLGESDTESECEATKNLTLMHKKLTEQTDFQKNLDVYLKGVRSFTAAQRIDQNEYLKRRTPQNAQKCNETAISMITTTPVKYNQQEYRRLLLRLHELQNSKKLQQASLLLKNSISAAKNNLGKGHRQILKPCLLVNGTSNYHWIKNQSRKVGQSQKVFEQQLLFIRKKIIDQSELIKRQKSEMQKLQMKKQLLLRQLKSINLLLNSAEKAITLNHQSRLLSSKQLSKLLRHQSILLNQQKRFSKTIQKASLENIPPMKINVTINNDNLELINKENEKTESSKQESDRFPDFAISVSSLSNDDRREVHIKTNNENSDNHSNNNLVNKLADNCEENRKKLVDCPINPSLSQLQITIEQNDVKESEKCLNYAEYDSTLLGLKPNSSGCSTRNRTF